MGQSEFTSFLYWLLNPLTAIMTNENERRKLGLSHVGPILLLVQSAAESLHSSIQLGLHESYSPVQGRRSLVESGGEHLRGNDSRSGSLGAL